MCFIICFSLDDFNLRDFRIGLKRGSDDCDCSSLLIDDNACRLCQLTWQWEDGTNMSYLRWADEDMFEPQGEDCARLSLVGWISQSCSAPMQYICERKVSHCHLDCALNVCLSPSFCLYLSDYHAHLLCSHPGRYWRLMISVVLPPTHLCPHRTVTS